MTCDAVLGVMTCDAGVIAGDDMSGEETGV